MLANQRTRYQVIANTFVLKADKRRIAFRFDSFHHNPLINESFEERVVRRTSDQPATSARASLSGSFLTEARSFSNTIVGRVAGV